MHSKRRLVVLLTGLFVLVMAFSGIAQARTINMRLGHGAQLAHPTHHASLRFAELIAERTNGAVKIDVFGNTQLGQEREMVEGLQFGTVDITVVSTGPLTGFVPQIGVVDLPFLFNSSEHAYKVFDGEIGQGLLKQFEPRGIVGLAFWENGWRHLTTGNRKVTTPDDLRGLKIRTMENRVHMDSFRAMGAAPVPMVWGEVYTGLQQGIIDGQENPITIVYTNALWEVQRYYALTGHFYGPHLVLMSKATFDRLSPEFQQIFRDTAIEVASFQRQLSAQEADRQVDLLREQGMDVYEVDRSLFQAATAHVASQYEATFGKDLLDAIRAAGE